MTKQNVRCDACGCAFVPEPKTQREGEIEYSYFNCDYCGKAYIVSVTDAALRKSIQKYTAFTERRNGTMMSEMELLIAARMKQANMERAAELRQMYIREERDENSRTAYDPCLGAEACGI